MKKKPQYTEIGIKKNVNQSFRYIRMLLSDAHKNKSITSSYLIHRNYKWKQHFFSLSRRKECAHEALFQWMFIELVRSVML